MWYNGWRIDYYPEGSQHWRAYRFGVRLRANSETLIRRMIDQRGPTLPD